ncbi:MAG: thioredoxin family protein [Oscillospiraceae bacterium]|nr:thioredoxin family protein [Oscillospiraceae bacterium]MDD3261905.1 thioredoxin family protein [Oscillospiraceae bacterium]
MQQISESEFLTAFAPSKAPSVVEFYSPQCGHCRLLADTLTQLETEFPAVRFAQVNIAAEMPLAERFDVQSVPTLLFWKNGEIYDRVVGNLHAQILRDKLKQIEE